MGPGNASETMMNEKTPAPPRRRWRGPRRSEVSCCKARPPAAIPNAANGNMIPVLAAHRAWSIE